MAEELGGGIIVKAGLRMGALGTPFILTVSYFGLVAAILLAMRSSNKCVARGLVPCALLCRSRIVPALPRAFSLR